MNKPNGKLKTATPLGIMVSAAGGGGLATVPLHRDAHGWLATLDGITFHLTATVTGPKRADD